MQAKQLFKTACGHGRFRRMSPMTRNSTIGLLTYLTAMLCVPESSAAGREFNLTQIVVTNASFFSVVDAMGRIDSLTADWEQVHGIPGCMRSGALAGGTLGARTMTLECEELRWPVIVRWIDADSSNVHLVVEVTRGNNQVCGASTTVKNRGTHHPVGVRIQRTRNHGKCSMTFTRIARDP